VTSGAPIAITLNSWPTLVFALVMLSWFALVILFAVRRKPSKAPERQRGRLWLLGMALQGTSYAIVWAFFRQPFTPLISLSKPLEIIVAILTIGVAIGSVWFVNDAIRTLGKQWSLAARLVEGHKLVTEGPYGIVRNPIYSGMFGMLLATGLAISHWLALIVAIAAFVVGTKIRIRSEEKLLRKAFGVEFEAYARKVPAIVPFKF
jgi:protein-S-isoprenylcysteine O-methyltransferase Ste14